MIYFNLHKYLQKNHLNKGFKIIYYIKVLFHVFCRPCGFFCLRNNDPIDSDIIKDIECTNSLEKGTCENGAQALHSTVVLCALTTFIMVFLLVEKNITLRVG